MDNYFSGDDILKYIVERGWKATMMCRHDRLPKDVPGHHFHNLKGKAVDLRSKVAHFEQPIIAVKRIPGQRIHYDSHIIPINRWHKYVFCKCFVQDWAVC